MVNRKGILSRRLKMVRARLSFAVVLLSLATLLVVVGASCSIPSEEKPEGTLTVAELLDNPVYDAEVTIFGTVGLLGELFCPCFELASGGQKVQVWYGLMVDNDGTERSAVSVEGINNGDKVIVTGELKGEGGTHYSKGDFWAIDIGIVQ